MQDSFEKFFLNKKVLYLMPFLYSLFRIASLVLYGIGEEFNTLLLIKGVIHIIVMFVLVLSYKKHDKNVMKGLIGAILMAVMIDSISITYEIFDNSELYDKFMNNNNSGFFGLLSLFYAFGIVLLFAIHFIINGDHHSSPTLVQSNQLLVLFVLAIGFIEVFLTLVLARFSVLTIGTACGLLATLFELVAVVCIESNLDFFRIKREEKAEAEKN